jgi:hypothetical protein
LQIAILFSAIVSATRPMFLLNKSQGRAGRLNGSFIFSSYILAEKLSIVVPCAADGYLSIPTEVPLAGDTGV